MGGSLAAGEDRFVGAPKEYPRAEPNASSSPPAAREDAAMSNKKRFNRVFNPDEDEDGMINLSKIAAERRAGKRPQSKPPSKLDSFLPRIPRPSSPPDDADRSFQDEVLQDLANDDLVPEDDDDFTPTPEDSPERVSSSEAEEAPEPEVVPAPAANDDRYVIRNMIKRLSVMQNASFA